MAYLQLGEEQITQKKKRLHGPKQKRNCPQKKKKKGIKKKHNNGRDRKAPGEKRRLQSERGWGARVGAAGETPMSCPKLNQLERSVLQSRRTRIPGKTAVNNASAIKRTPGKEKGGTQKGNEERNLNWERISPNNSKREKPEG